MQVRETEVQKFGNALAAYLIGEVHRIAPPVLLAQMIESFPVIIRDETEAFLANLEQHGAGMAVREKVKAAG